MTHPYFYILIKDPFSQSLLGWCLPSDVENLRRAYPYLQLQPFPAKSSPEEMKAAAVYCGIEACARHSEIRDLLKLHDDLERERQEVVRGAAFTVSEKLLKGLERKIQEHKKKDV